MSDHFLPIDRRTVRDRLTALGGDPALLDALIRVLAWEGQELLEELKQLYAPLDPNRDTAPTGDTADGAAFADALERLLGRANYRRLTDAELQHALEAESLFKVRLHVELADFADLRIFVRGSQQRTETITGCFGLKKRALAVDFFDKVVLLVRFKGVEHFATRKKPLAFTPGTTLLKLFANVPVADLEMLFPNSEVRMKTVDKVMIGVPAAIGIATMAAKVSAVLLFLWALAHVAAAKVGAPVEAKDPSLLLAEAGAVIAACVAMGMFIMRQVNRYRLKQLQFIKALSDNLYFRNLDNNAGAFHRVIDDASEEEGKEALLAWHFLQAGPASEQELDDRVEAWLGTTLGRTIDFEVDDALAKLERLGLACRTGDQWATIPASEALASLRRRWAAIGTPA
jgi:hypothetical protein